MLTVTVASAPCGRLRLRAPSVSRSRVVARAAKGKRIIVRMRGDEDAEPAWDERYMQRDSDFYFFPGGVLYPLHPLHQTTITPVGLTLQPASQVAQLKEGGLYAVGKQPGASRIEGWQVSIIAGDEQAAQSTGMAYAHGLLRQKGIVGATVEPLRSTGQLRTNNRRYTVGQVDAGVVVCLPSGIKHALLISKKTRLLVGNVAAHYNMMKLIEKHRNGSNFDSLVEFRGMHLHGALMAEALPEDPLEMSDLLDGVKSYNFVLFVRNGAEFSSQPNDHSLFLR